MQEGNNKKTLVVSKGIIMSCSKTISSGASGGKQNVDLVANTNIAMVREKRTKK